LARGRSRPAFFALGDYLLSDENVAAPENYLLDAVCRIALLIPGYFGAQDSPSILTPFPAFAFLPLALLVSPARNPTDARTFTAMRIVGAILPLVFFLAWNPRLMLGQMNTPKRTYVLVTVSV